MQTEVEAPVTEPLSFRKVTRRYAGAHRPRGHRPERRGGRADGGRRPLRLRQVDAARAVAGPAGARRGRAGCHRAPRRRCAYMPQRDLLLPWRDALGNAALALECQGVPARRGAPARRAAVRALRPRRVRARAAGRAVGRDAPARRVPAHAPAGPPGAAARRAVRRARLDHARVDAASGSPTRSRDEPRTVLLVTHDVEEAVFLADRIVGALAAAGPGGRRDRRGRSRRPRDVTSPEFGAAQARARWRRSA